jgi:glutamyl-tRNA reductase
MASIAAKHLRGRGVADIRVLNRSAEHARALAARIGARSAGLDELPEALASADLIVSATGATGIVIDAEAVRTALEGRSGLLVLVYIAVPRDVDPDVAGLDGVR